MAENKKVGIFQYTNKNNLSDVEEIREEKKVQEQLLDMMYMFQRYYGIIKENEYVLRESVLDCYYGTKNLHIFVYRLWIKGMAGSRLMER